MAYANKQDAIDYINNYQKEKYDRITVMATKGKKAEYQEAAKLCNMSLSAFVMAAVEEKIEKNKEKFNNAVDRIG